MTSRDPEPLARARELRKSSTLAEARLWEQLRAKRMGVKFVRQHPVDPYFVDFACRSDGLVIEVDGATHSTEEEIRRDAARTAFLDAEGYRVLRFQNEEILQGLDEVLIIIKHALQR